MQRHGKTKCEDDQRRGLGGGGPVKLYTGILTTRKEGSRQSGGKKMVLVILVRRD